MKIFLKKSVLSTLLTISLGSTAYAQDAWEIITSGTTAELRGLSVVSKNVVWASGTKGTILKTTDGNNWKNMSILEASNLDFRDIQGIDKNTAIAMSAGPGKASTIYKTTDGGEHWQLLKVNQAEAGFWDAIAFWDEKNGVLFGDPINGQFEVLITADGGLTWKEAASDTSQLSALANEGAFAASGTCVAVQGHSEIWLATGGASASRIFHSSDKGKTWTVAQTQIPANAPPKGAFSVAFSDAKHGFAVGGDYQKPKGEDLNAVVSQDGGKTWQASAALPSGFLSVVAKIPHKKNSFVVGGLAGSGITHDGGKTWKVLGETPLNALEFADLNHGWAVGPKGLLMKYVGK
ncbi:MAG: hypothetical protein K2P84_01565 [Undibacterium sp.]|nr:hypothetical protein [Undibacterium sp.]